MTDRSKHCAACGQARKPLEQRRGSWGTKIPTRLVPRDEAKGKPWQVVNDLIVHAGVYRNGGTNESTHLCDDCLRIGLRAIKAEVDTALEIVEAGADKDAEIASLNERLALAQAEAWRLRNDLENTRRRLEEATCSTPK